MLTFSSHYFSPVKIVHAIVDNLSQNTQHVSSELVCKLKLAQDCNRQVANVGNIDMIVASNVAHHT